MSSSDVTRPIDPEPPASTSPSMRIAHARLEGTLAACAALGLGIGLALVVDLSSPPSASAHLATTAPGTADTVPGKEPTAWFVGFGPTADPQYVVVCVIDQAGYGATAAAPVVRDVFSYLASHPVGPATVPPNEKASQATTPVALPVAPVSPTTTTTTLPG